MAPLRRSIHYYWLRFMADFYSQMLSRIAELPDQLAPVVSQAQIDELLARMPKPVGSFGFDPWGYNERTARRTLAAGAWLYHRYFRAQAFGLEQVPREGRVLLVANHSGQLPVDGLLIGVALATNTLAPRACRPMIERFFPNVPFVAPWLTESGAVIGEPLNCARMLDRDEAVLVFPEGARGSGKLWKQRYQLQRFGTGFMHLAMRHGAPIIPVGVVGCEESMPSFANIKPLARMFGLPYFPLCPSYLPLPSRVILNFGAPMHFDADYDSEQQVAERVEHVRERIRALIAQGLHQREAQS